MGLIDWIKQHRKQACRPLMLESVWMTKRAKLSGIRARLTQLSETNAVIVVLAYFPDTLAELNAMLQQSGISFETQPKVQASELAQLARQKDPATIVTALAGGLVSDMSAKDPLKSNGCPVTLILAERHLIRDWDELVEEFAAEYSFTLLIHVSLDDPVIARFAGPSTVAGLQQLGMSETDCISHKWISSSIQRLQAKVKKESTGDHAATSAEEWLLKNLSA